MLAAVQLRLGVVRTEELQLVEERTKAAVVAQASLELIAGSH